VDRAGGVKDEEPQDVEEQQNYKNYPGHYLLRPIRITFECVRMIAEFPGFFNWALPNGRATAPRAAGDG
jgi:hypothetical protein